MSWQQLSIVSRQQTVAAITDLLTELGAQSVTYLDAADQAIYEPKPGETAIWQNTRIVGLFTMDIDVQVVLSVICHQFHDINHADCHLETLQEQIWERTWMEHFHAMKFADRLWVCPSGQERHEPGTVCLVLDPGLAFGTGTHATTALCLKWLAEHDVAGKTIIDYGCGSGILAVAAVLLGAEVVYAVDIDEQAITATLENAQKNQVVEQIHCYLPEAMPALQADIVLANILAGPLTEMSDTISALVQPGGHLILSGILQEQVQSVVDSYAEFNMALPQIKDEWCRIDGRKI